MAASGYDIGMWIVHSSGIRSAREPSYLRLMIVDGAQIRAGRALIGWHQRDLAAAAQVHLNTVAALEKREQLSLEMRRRCHGALEAIERALKGEGVTMLSKSDSAFGVGLAL